MSLLESFSSKACGASILGMVGAKSMGACSVYYDAAKGAWMMQSGPNQGWQQCSATCMKK